MPRVKHGHSTRTRKTPTYLSWQSMKMRCLNPRYKKFYLYGGRGISICERWKASYENFLDDMGDRPSGMTLDRYPNKDGNYEPGNCRWATQAEQHSNRRAYSTGHAFKTQCPRGHEYSGGNLYIDARGSRSCRQCKLLSQNRIRSLRRQQPSQEISA
jgi:hypothetical protein